MVETAVLLGAETKTAKEDFLQVLLFEIEFAKVPALFCRLPPANVSISVSTLTSRLSVFVFFFPAQNSARRTTRRHPAVQQNEPDRLPAAHRARLGLAGLFHHRHATEHHSSRDVAGGSDC